MPPDEPTLEDALAHAADLIAGADALLVAAGAGMGVDSGLPDFRGNEGFWKAYPALAGAGLPFTRVASPATFSRDPALAWGFYGHRLALYRATVPHAGFGLLARWTAERPLAGRVFTSNVDGHFQRAGFAADTVTECHGSIHHLQCSVPCSDALWPADDFMPEVDGAACRLLNAPPTCPHCGALARPNILMFGDGQWVEARTRNQLHAEEMWLADMADARARIAVVELGAGTAIASVRAFGGALVQHYGARLVRINTREPAVARQVGVGIALGALEALTRLDAAMRA